MKIKIKVTKEVLSRAKYCGTEKQPGFIIKNCAIAVAIRDIFPDSTAGIDYITVYGIKTGSSSWIDIPYIDVNAVGRFIKLFDGTDPELRSNLDTFEFEVYLPENIVEAINIDDIHKSETLEAVL